MDVSKINYCIYWTDMLASCQKVQKSDFQSQFSMSEIIYLFRNTFLVIDTFWWHEFSKHFIFYNDVTMSVHKLQSLSEYWFLSKNLSDFISLPWKLNKPYYHKIIMLTVSWFERGLVEDNCCQREYVTTSIYIVHCRGVMSI